MLRKNIFIFIMLFILNSSSLSATSLESTQQLLGALKTKLVTLLNTVNNLQSPQLEKNLANQLKDKLSKLNKELKTKGVIDELEEKKLLNDIKKIFDTNEFKSSKDLFPTLLPLLTSPFSEANLFQFLVNDHYYKTLIDNECEEILQKKLKRYSSLIDKNNLEIETEKLIQGPQLEDKLEAINKVLKTEIEGEEKEEEKEEEKKEIKPTQNAQSIAKSIKTLTEKAKNHLNTNNNLEDFIISFKNQWLKRQDLIDWINNNENKIKLTNTINSEVNENIKTEWNQWLEKNEFLHTYAPELLTEEMKIRKENATKNENVLKTYNKLKDDIEFFINKGDQGNFINGITKEIISDNNNLKQFIKKIHDENEKKYKTQKEEWKNLHGNTTFHVFNQKENIKKLTELIKKYTEPSTPEKHQIKTIIDFFKTLSQDQVKLLLSKENNLQIEFINNIEKFCDLIDQLNDKTNGKIHFKDQKKELLKQKFPLEYLKEYPTDTTFIENLTPTNFKNYIDKIKNLEDLIKLTKLSKIPDENVLKQQIKNNIDNSLENKIKTYTKENALWFGSALKAQPDTIKNFIQKNPLLIKTFKEFIEEIKKEYPPVENIDQVTTTLEKQEETKNKIITEKLPQIMNSLSLKNAKEFFIESPLTSDPKEYEVIEKHLHEKDNFKKFLNTDFGNKESLLPLLHIYYLHLYKNRFNKIDIEALTNKIEEEYKKILENYNQLNEKLNIEGFGKTKIKKFDKNINNKFIQKHFELFLKKLNAQQLQIYSKNLSSAILDEQIKSNMNTLVENELKFQKAIKLNTSDKNKLEQIFQPGTFPVIFSTNINVKHPELNDNNKINFLKVLSHCPLEEWRSWISMVNSNEDKNKELKSNFLLNLVENITEDNLTKPVNKIFFDLIKVPLRGQLILKDLLVKPLSTDKERKDDVTTDDSEWDD